MRFFFVLLLLMCLQHSALVGQDSNQIAIQHLPDGVYLSYEEIREMKPSLVQAQLFRSMYDTGFTIYQWSRSPSHYYFDKDSNKTSLQTDQIVLFSEGGTVYIQQHAFFHKASLFGAITVFTEVYPKISTPMAVAITDVNGSARDRMLDIESKSIMDYTLLNFQSILKRDKELYREFMKIKSAKQRRRQVYRFIERYNQRNPFYSE
ncbi:MAG: hypothetical protein LC117_09040 [Bacteroidia bacterium]|nr:hypothetical protein [Bacteroidia bacterium]MCZ2278057.1 hypothetical protein [Bacteroidia bacterium]